MHLVYAQSAIWGQCKPPRSGLLQDIHSWLVRTCSQVAVSVVWLNLLRHWLNMRGTDRVLLSMLACKYFCLTVQGHLSLMQIECIRYRHHGVPTGGSGTALPIATSSAKRRTLAKATSKVYFGSVMETPNSRIRLML
jgi:hypothetical protein